MDSSTYLHPLDPMQTAFIWCFLQVSVVAPSTMVTPWQAIGTGRRAAERNYVFTNTVSLVRHYTLVTKNTTNLKKSSSKKQLIFSIKELDN